MSGYTLMSGVMTVTKSVFCPVCRTRQDATQKHESDLVRNRYGRQVHAPRSAYFPTAELCCSPACQREWRRRVGDLFKLARTLGYTRGNLVRETQERGVLKKGMRDFVQDHIGV